MLIERYCEKRLGTRAITARTIVRERKLRKLSKLSKRIEKGEVASGIFVFGVKISIAMINSAAISG